MVWQLQEAKSKFSQVVNKALDEGPQYVTRHGKRVVVIVAVEEFVALRKKPPSLAEALLNSPLRGSGLVIERDQDATIRELDLS